MASLPSDITMDGGLVEAQVRLGNVNTRSSSHSGPKHKNSPTNGYPPEDPNYDMELDALDPISNTARTSEERSDSFNGKGMDIDKRLTREEVPTRDKESMCR